MPSERELSDFLDWMRTDVDGLYLLGSLNRHVTVHSQQRRAINLIYALDKLGGGDGLNEKSIAIVGAGFAGLTAAAYAIEETGAAVTLFDSAPRPLWLQDSCANRWLHPGIYDWPLPGALEPRTSLPVLNWRADRADNVAKQVRAEWERIAARKQSLVSRFETRVTAVTAETDGKLLVELENGGAARFDRVVLAVGFGMEVGGLGRVGYWNDADGLDSIRPDSSVLISGFGDGGLADVLRLCLPQFQQHNLVELIKDVPTDTCEQLIDWERGNKAALEGRYEQLLVPEIFDRLKDDVSLARVTLAGSGSLYGQRSAILNRFLVSQLRKARGDDAFKLVKAPVDENSLCQLRDGRTSIKVVGETKPREYHHVVLRLGPQAIFQEVKPLDVWSAGAIRRRHWYELPQSLDETRKPVWEDEIAAAATSAREDFLVYESSSRPWCLVLCPTGISSEKSESIKLIVRTALLRVHDSGLSDLNRFPLMLASGDALSAETAVKDAVRALCAAHIVVADITGYDPGVLFLLGIRAAVRRGVTITCSWDKISWDSVPFNLKELRLLSLSDRKRVGDELAEALSAGLTQSLDSDLYLDLPVYDYVRQDPTSGETRVPPPALFLRPFISGADVRAQYLETLIGPALRDSNKWPALPRIEAVIDQASPRLAGQRLYEAIRHWQICIVDLTLWRPNVLFELGVRLVVQKQQTICLLDETVEGKATFAGVRTTLRDLLRPSNYSQQTTSLAGAVARPTPTYIYETALRHFRTRQDHVDRQVDQFLEAAAPSKATDDSQQEVDWRQLYARNNREYSGELNQINVEMRCAAWYYLAEREQPHRMRPVDLLDPSKASLFRRFERLGFWLTRKLGHLPRDKLVLERIEACMAEASESGIEKLADLLDAWVLFRANSPWKKDLAKPPDKGSQVSIANLKRRRAQLGELQTLLKAIGGPACVLPLQGLQSDMGRLDIILQKAN
jgi:hypothetical protein